MSPDKNGLGGNVIFIDTENTFRAERIFQIAEHRGINNPDDILRKIYVCKIYNTSHLEIIIQDLGKSIEEYKAKLVIVDSIIALHRAEFTGRPTLADRQQRLKIMLHKLSSALQLTEAGVALTRGDTIQYIYTDAAHSNPLRRVTPIEFIDEGREQVYDKEKYREMLPEAAETVLGYFGFDRTAYGDTSRSISSGSSDRET